MKTWIGRPAPFGSRTRRPTSTLSGMGAPYPRASAPKRVLKSLEGLIERVGLDLLLPDRAGVGDRGAVAHHVDATLRRANQPGPRDLDPRLNTLTGGMLPERADRGKPRLAPDLLNLPASSEDRFSQGRELLPADLAAMTNSDLPAHRRAA